MNFLIVDTTQILYGLSGHFEGGKITAVIGESGCGKTSLMDIISGYRYSEAK